MINLASVSSKGRVFGLWVCVACARFKFRAS